MYSHPEFPFSLIYKIRRTAHAVLAVFELLTFNRRYLVRWINPVVVVSPLFSPPRRGMARAGNIMEITLRRTRWDLATATRKSNALKVHYRSLRNERHR